MTPRHVLSACERRAQILATATCLFAKRGFAGTTSAALAKACGVSEALIYKLFENKERLYAAMIEHKLETWAPLTVEGDPARSDEQVLTALAAQIFARVVEDPDFVRLLYYSELQESAFARQFQEARGLTAMQSLGDYLAARAAQGALRDDVDPYLVAANFLCQVWHYATGVKVWGRESLYPAADDAEAIRTMVTIFVRGLRP